MGPKNRNAKMATDVKSKNAIVGKHVRYIGMGDRWYICPSCNNQFLRGFFWEEGEVNGCSQQCLKSQLKEVEQ